MEFKPTTTTEVCFILDSTKSNDSRIRNGAYHDLCFYNAEPEHFRTDKDRIGDLVSAAIFMERAAETPINWTSE